MGTPNCYGMDLGWEMTQISFYRWKTKEAESVCPSGGQREFLMPALLCQRTSDGEWVAGEEAIRCAAGGAGTLVSALLKKLCDGETVTIGESVYAPEFLMEQYLKRMLEMIRKWNSDGDIAKLAVTLPNGAAAQNGVLADIFAGIGLEEEKLVLLSRTECFMYYVVNTAPELWSSKVALFDYSEKELYYESMSFSRKKQPVTVVSEQKELTEETRKPGGGETAERRAYWFYNLAMQQLYKQPAATVYVTGTGFAGGWAENALRQLCSGRRVFLGQNLYTKGACQAARMFCDGTGEGYILLSGNMVQESIALRVYTNSEESYLELVRAGTDYRKAGAKLNIILDDTNEIDFLVSHALRKEPVHEVMILEHLMERENKTIRLQLELFFVDRETPVVQVRDLGFASYQKTGRIWEQLL